MRNESIRGFLLFLQKKKSYNNRFLSHSLIQIQRENRSIPETFYHYVLNGKIVYVGYDCRKTEQMKIFQCEREELMKKVTFELGHSTLEIGSRGILINFKLFILFHSRPFIT